MKILLLTIFILNGTLVKGQVLKIEIQGKSYHIKGDNLTIIVGKNPIINISKEVPKYVKESIKAKYQNKIETLNQKHKNNQITFSEQQRLLERYKIEYETANAVAEKLALEFSSVDFSKQSYLYRLAYVLYNEGNIEAAQNVLSDFNLERNEECQSVQYILSSTLLWSSGKKKEALLRLETASKKYPSFITYGNLGDYLYKNGNYENAIVQYQQAAQFAKNLKEKYCAFINCAYCLSFLSRKNESKVYADKAQLVEKSLNEPAQIDTTCYLAPPFYALPIAFTQARLNYILGSIENPNNADKAYLFFEKALNLINTSLEISEGDEFERLVLRIECYIGLKEKILANEALSALYQIVRNSNDEDYSFQLYEKLKLSIENL